MFNPLEIKLLRQALDRSVTKPEAEAFWLKLLELLRHRKVSGYDIEAMAQTINHENIISAYMSRIARKPRKIDPLKARDRAHKAAQARWAKRQQST